MYRQRKLLGFTARTGRLQGNWLKVMPKREPKAEIENQPVLHLFSLFKKIKFRFPAEKLPESDRMLRVFRSKTVLITAKQQYFRK